MGIASHRDGKAGLGRAHIRGQHIARFGIMAADSTTQPIISTRHFALLSFTMCPLFGILLVFSRFSRVSNAPHVRGKRRRRGQTSLWRRGVGSRHEHKLSCCGTFSRPFQRQRLHCQYCLRRTRGTAPSQHRQIHLLQHHVVSFLSLSVGSTTTNFLVFHIRNNGLSIENTWSDPAKIYWPSTKEAALSSDGAQS